MKNILPLLLVSLFVWTTSAEAKLSVACIGKDKTVAPDDRTYESDGKTYETDVWKDWKNNNPNHVTTRNYSCCDGLTKDANRVCKDDSMADPEMVTCGGQGKHSDCSDGKGCYATDAEDLFNTQPDDKKFDTQMSAETEAKENGDTCYKDKQCASYNCKDMKCTANYICRLAEAGENAPGDVKCEVGLVKNAQGDCYSENGMNYYWGNITPISVQKEEGQMCQWYLQPSNIPRGNLADSINVGILTTRAMEFLYSTVSATRANQDCLKLYDFLDTQFSQLLNERKDILLRFNQATWDIERNFALVNSAQLEDPAMIETLCETKESTPEKVIFQQASKHTIASRKAAGLDFLCYLKQRNKLFRRYESEMLGWSSRVHSTVKAYIDSAFTWSAEDKSWSIGGTMYGKGGQEIDCHERPWKNRKVKRRMTQGFEVWPLSGNLDILEEPGVKMYLGFLGDENWKKEFTKRYFLADALMPGDGPHSVPLTFESFGVADPRSGTAGAILSIATAELIPEKDHIRHLVGTGARGSLREIYNSWGDLSDGGSPFILYYKGLNNSGDNDKFIYEPEIPGGFESRGCLNKIDSPECGKFKQYLKDVKDTAFAQFLAYSNHNRDDYKHFFLKQSGWRRKLFTQYEVDLTNLEDYYTKLSSKGGLRDLQLGCLQKAIDQFDDKDIAAPEEVGLVSGNGATYGKNSVNYLKDDPKVKSITPKASKVPAIPKAFHLAAYISSVDNIGGLKDSVSKNSSASSKGGSANFSGTGSDSLAARTAAMAAANAKAGALAKAKEKSYRESVQNANIFGKNSSAGAAGQGGAGLTSGSGSGSGSSSSSDASSSSNSGKKVGLDPKSGANAAATTGAGAGVVGGASSGYKSGASAGSGAAGGYISGSGSGSSSSSNSEDGAVPADATGMSDEEKSIMAQNYDRNKGNYKANEDDSLFQSLSKAYIRSLDKILIRKKKVDEQ